MITAADKEMQKAILSERMANFIKSDNLKMKLPNSSNDDCKIKDDPPSDNENDLEQKYANLWNKYCQLQQKYATLEKTHSEQETRITAYLNLNDYVQRQIMLIGLSKKSEGNLSNLLIYCEPKI